MTDTVQLQMSVNGTEIALDVCPDKSLLQIIRNDLGLTGTKCGCNVGSCGSCMVIVNGKAQQSCSIKPAKLNNAIVETIESLASNGSLHPIQTAFVERHSVQCGYCTPGMVMSAKALLDQNEKPNDDEIKKALRFNLCRCTGYQQIIEAVRQASGQLNSGEEVGGMDIVGGGGRTPELSVIGRSVKQTGANALVTGRAQFTDDLPNPKDVLYLATKRSDRAHALIKSIDYSEAEKIPGVLRVITAKDITGENKYGKIIRDIPVLASDKVLSYADAIALVVAESYEIAQSACEKIEIEYEDLEPIFDPRKSMDNDAPKLHDHLKDNLLYDFNIIKGDTTSGFAQCDEIIEEQFETVQVDHAQLEPEAALAYFDDDGKLCVKAPTQHVFFDRLNIIRALGLPKDDVRVIQPSVGGAFGKREDVYGQIHTALAAFLTRRPVRTIYSREETFKFTQKRHPVIIKVKIGASKEGKILAFEGDVLSDTGAYSSWGPNILRKICVHLSGPYEIPNVRIYGRSVYTNNIFCGAMRGFGTPQAVFASESALDMLAEKLNIDRVEIRKINSFKPGSKTATGQAVKIAPGRETIELSAEKIGWDEPLVSNPENPAIKRGRGVASLWYGIGFGAGIPDEGDAIVELPDNGRAKVFVSSVDYGQGSNTVFSQIAAETLGLKIDKITMVTGDSDTTPNCGSTVATRQTYITGNAILNTCTILAGDLKAVAATLLNRKAEDVILKNDIAFDASDEACSIPMVDVILAFEKEGKPKRRQAKFKGQKYTERLDPKTGQGNAYHPIAYGTQAVELSVNTTNGRVKVDRIVACHYIGRALNPEAVRGQVIGGISMGWGYALTEDSRLVEGQIQADNFGKYRMMKTTDLPKYDVILLEDPEKTGPYGAIGIGEPPTVATAPAIINAIYDAIGVRITELPATPQKIKAALKAKEAKAFAS